MSFFESTRKPVGFGGKIMVAMMNSGHGAMADWGFEYITIPEDVCVLDAGCGGGTNIKKLLAKCPKGWHGHKNALCHPRTGFLQNYAEHLYPHYQ